LRHTSRMCSPNAGSGVGWRTLADLPTPADAASLSIADVDAAFEAIGSASGSGSAAARRDRLDALLRRATAAEQDYLRGLLLGGVRQGAQDGVMLAAIAKAADVPLSAVQRAAMLAGFAGPVAVAALTGGQDALAAVSVEVGAAAAANAGRKCARGGRGNGRRRDR
jgi:DNA ligase-1